MTTFPYEGLVEPESVNMDAGRLARVVARFKNQQLSGSFPGGQLVLRRNGQLVLNEAIGIGRGFRPIESAPGMQVQSPNPPPSLFRRETPRSNCYSHAGG